MSKDPSKTKSSPQPPSDPSALVSATELGHWKRNPTTRKVLAFLGAWREQVKEYMGEGGTIAATSDATAVQTVEASAKVQILGDILALEAKDIAKFYGLEEPQERKPQSTT